MTSPAHDGRIVVGVDGSPGSYAALRWAADEALKHGVGLDVVHAWTVPVSMFSDGIVFEPEPFETQAEAVVADAMAAVAALDPVPPDIRSRLVQEDALEALVASAAGADLLVVGTRGLGGFAGLLLGSVGQNCVEHAPCPVAVIPPTAMTPSHGRVVVGVDGSEASFAALEWAVAEATRRRARLAVVNAYHRHQLESPIGPPGAVDHDSVRKASRALVVEMIDKAMASAVDRPPDVEAIAVATGAARALIEAAGEADVLVVGSRGRHGWRRALLGSVSRQCTHHAPCPVVVIRRRPSTDAEDDS